VAGVRLRQGRRVHDPLRRGQRISGCSEDERRDVCRCLLEGDLPQRGEGLRDRHRQARRSALPGRSLPEGERHRWLDPALAARALR